MKRHPTDRPPSLYESAHNTPVNDPSPVDRELSTFLQSLPPPPMPVRQRDARPWTDSQVRDIDMLQQELRNSVARQAAEKIAESAERAKVAEGRMSERAREDREVVRLTKVGLVVTLGSAGAIGLCTLLYELSRLVKP